MVRADGFEHSLAYGKRGRGFRWPLFFTRILESWLCIDSPELHRFGKIKEAEAASKIFYNNRIHQPDTTGRPQEKKPLDTRIFFDYFDFVDTCNIPTNAARNARQYHTYVNISLVGQQAVLSLEETPIFLNTITPAGRESRTGDIGG